MDVEQRLENLAATFQQIRKTTLSKADAKQWPNFAEFLQLRKAGHFPLPETFNSVTDANLRVHAEQLALSTRVPPSFREPTVAQERLRQCFVERYVLCAMRLCLPPDMLIDEDPYEGFQSDMKALRAYRKRHPLPPVPLTDDDRKLLEHFLHRTCEAQRIS